MLSLLVNGKNYDVDVDPATPLLWVIREQLQLTGTKFGCGVAQCGSCTVHLDGQPIRSCITTIASVNNRQITTIEGVNGEKNDLHDVQKAWIKEQVPQCGYCQSGQIMSAISLLEEHPDPTDDDIDLWMSGIVCRCGTYSRIRKAIKRAASSATNSLTIKNQKNG